MSHVKDISELFSGCKLLKSLPDISKWEKNNIINMDELFKDCQNLINIPDISIWISLI